MAADTNINTSNPSSVASESQTSPDPDTSTVTARSASRASLLGLLAEIRLRIYGYVYQDSSFTSFRGYDPLAKEEILQISRNGFFFPTLLVCKQITAEAIPALASHITMTVYDIDRTHLQFLSNKGFFRVCQYVKEMGTCIYVLKDERALGDLLSRFSRLERLHVGGICSPDPRAEELQHIRCLPAHEKEAYLDGRRDEALIKAVEKDAKRSLRTACPFMPPDADRTYEIVGKICFSLHSWQLGPELRKWWGLVSYSMRDGSLY
jgi:hypothetical protein